MDGMMLHCGAAKATFDELKAVQLPEEHAKFKDKMEHYKTIPHHMLVGSIRALLKENIHPDVIVGEEFGLSTGRVYPGARMFGLLKLDLTPRESPVELDEVEASLESIEAADQSDQNGYPAPDPEHDPEGVYDPDEAAPTNVDEPQVQVLDTVEIDAISPSMVFRNSYDRSMSAAGGLGYNCFVCDNLALSGEIMFARKHTKNALGDVIRVFMQMIVTMHRQYEFDCEFREAAKAREMKQDAGFELLGRMAGNGLLAFTGGEESEFARSIKEWRNPTHECFKDRTLWSLFNAVTAAQARTKINHRLETGSMASKVFREVLGQPWVDKAAEISSEYADAARVR